MKNRKKKVVLSRSELGCFTGGIAEAHKKRPGGQIQSVCDKCPFRGFCPWS